MTGSTSNGRWHKGRDQFLLALADGASICAAAEKAGICRQTGSRWLRDPEFALRLENQRSQTYSVAATRMCVMHESAIEVIGEMLKSANESLRFRAARTILQYGRLKDSETERRLLEVRRHYLRRLYPKSYHPGDEDDAPGEELGDLDLNEAEQDDAGLEPVDPSTEERPSADAAAEQTASDGPGLSGLVVRLPDEVLLTELRGRVCREIERREAAGVDDASPRPKEKAKRGRALLQTASLVFALALLLPAMNPARAKRAEPLPSPNSVTKTACGRRDRPSLPPVSPECMSLACRGSENRSNISEGNKTSKNRASAQPSRRSPLPAALPRPKGRMDRSLTGMPAP